MGQDVDRVRSAFSNVQVVDAGVSEAGTKAADEPPFDISPRGEAPPSSDDGPDMIDDGGDVGNLLPPGFPVQPLGMAGGKFYFLTARGELTELSAGQLNHRGNLVALVSGALDPIIHLGNLAPPEGKRDSGFNVSGVSDALMGACSRMPLFDPSMQVRHFGTWRGASGHPIVHLGEDLIVNDKEPRQGRMINRALYPAVPSRPAPSVDLCAASDIAFVRDRIRDFWAWQTASAADVLIGFIGQAVLGQYPDWRAHCWIKGKHGGGKTSLLNIISLLMGAMSLGVKNSTSAAAMRQTTNHMAVARVFDEAEKTGSGAIEEVISLFRLMSGAEGAQVERGTSDHSGVRFNLYGAGLLASIIPGSMAPQDQSRFVILSLGPIPATGDPETKALQLQDLEDDAKELGAKIWGRMLSLAPERWDRTFRIYNAMVQGMGGVHRTGDTVGAILAGWDLMLFDAPLVDPHSGEPKADRIARAKEIAQPLIDVTREAEEAGEAERFLSTLFGTYINKDHGGAVTVAELIEQIQEINGEMDYSNKLLGRLGLRMMAGDAGEKDLFIVNGGNPLLDRAMAGTRWKGGGHVAALETESSIRKSPRPVRVAGRASRGSLIPARFLPGGKGQADEAGGYDSDA